ncbi:hypothetical protein [Chondromyces apiculatus]|uniref:Uncharacterized protein n=1 Tax=Chondromyces apiculatus DSM 436 TaxID=1192034 RepID=A0A017TD71_9BACT|nr:hypothetical protein [Chondromyces apiculatus]EYF07243.1 Hypothetical protein CAP_0722 [Chondromyces apiculatus DSM 436]
MPVARPTVWLSVCVLLGYAVTSRVVEDLYPFSTFSMYAQHGGTAVSRIVARTADGRVHPVRAFVDWSCDGALDLSPARCGEPGSFDYTGYLDAEDAAHLEAAHLEAHHAPGVGEPVEIVRRVWKLGEVAGPPGIEDCPLHRCRARLASP